MREIIIIALLTALAYSNIFQNSFMIDDETFIVNWPLVKSAQNLPKLLAGEVPEIHRGVYRPIRSVLYFVYQQVWGENPVGYHIHSMAVNILSAVLVYLIILQITKKKTPAFIGGLLFGLHPVHTESITYISASMEMTGVVFFLASFLLYIKLPKELKSPKLLISVLFALLAFFTYEMTLTLPFLIILHDLCFRFRPRLKIYLPYFLGAAAFFFIRMVILQIGADRGDYLGFSFYHTMLTMSKVMVKYIWLLISPLNVSYLHDLAPGFESFMTYHSNVAAIRARSILDWDILASIIILIGLVAIDVKSFKNHPLVSFCLGWFFIALLPVSYIFPQGIAIADKYLYIASFGFILLLATFLNRLIEKKGRLKALGLAIIILLVATYGTLTFLRNRDWQNPFNFWHKLEVQHPKSALTVYTLGVLYGERGNFDKAENYYLKTISLDPGFWEAYFNLGNIYARQGKFDLAREEYQQVLLINPDFEPAKANLSQYE